MGGMPGAPQPGHMPGQMPAQQPPPVSAPAPYVASGPPVSSAGVQPLGASPGGMGAPPMGMGAPPGGMGGPPGGMGGPPGMGAGGPPRAAPAPAAAPQALGEPMAAHDLAHVRNVLQMLLDASAQDGNMKKRDDIAKRLEELYSKLQNGQIKTAAAEKVLQLVKSVEAQDFASANRLQQELCSVDWDQNKTWLMGMKRLIPAR